MSYLKATGTAIIYIGLFLTVITFLPGLPPKTEFQEFDVILRDWNSKLSPKLNGAEKLFKDELHGPEDLVTYNGQLYTGLHGGYVVRVEEDRIVPIVKFGQKCDGVWQEEKCGRPLGLNFDKTGNLYVVDTYYGIFKVNVATGEYKNIVNTSKPIEGMVPQIPNSVDVAENGDLYWTDSSTDFKLYDLLQAYLSNPSGRLIRYNAAKKRNEVLLRNIGFANGVALSDDESYVIVSDMTKQRLLKYNLKGPKTGQTEIFIDGLPGPVDNLHSDGHGGFLGVLYFVTDSEHPHFSVSVAPHPYLRKMAVRLLFVMELPIKLIHDIYPNTYTERLLHAIGSTQGFQNLMDTKQKSYVLRIDASGNIVDLLSSEDDTLGSGLSSACIHNGYLWLGSPFKHYLIRVPFSINSEKQSESSKRDTAKSAESKQGKASHTTSKSTATPTKSTAAPTTSNPSAVTPKPTAAPKPSPSPKVDKSSETKSTSKSANAEITKENAKVESSRTTKEDNAKTKSGKNIKVEQDSSTKQKTQKLQSEKVKSETNRPKEEL